MPATSPIKICYVCGGIGAYACTFKHGIYDDAALYDLRYRIVGAFQGQPSFVLYYKFGFNSEQYDLALEKRILKREFQNVIPILSSEKLVDYLDAVDLFIIDSLSTPLYEVLTTRKPVIFLGDKRSLAFAEDAEHLLRKRVTFVKDRAEMESSIDDLIRHTRASKVFTIPDHNDASFIKSYAFRGAGCSSAEYTAEILMRILENGDLIRGEDKQEHLLTPARST